MSSVRMRKLWTVLAVCAAGTVFVPGGCVNYLTEQTLTAFNFCKVFNCTPGSFFSFCNPDGGGLFLDCPGTTTAEP